jgi:hypothetical protein
MMAIDRAIAQDCRALEHVAQLAHIRRPAVSQQRVARLIGQTRRSTAHRLAELARLALQR